MLLPRVSTKYSKILFQDDFLIGNSYLATAVDCLEMSGKDWLASSSAHVDKDGKKLNREILPRFPYGLKRGNNRIGSPSTILFRTEKFLKFNENLHYMYDCEWYLKMAHKYGKPYFLKTESVAIRIHKDQATNKVFDSLAREIKITKECHSDTFLQEIRLIIFNKKSTCKCQSET